MTGLAESPVVVFNPFRVGWPNCQQLLEEQYQWEREHIDSACLRAIWFPSETVCPIALLELGYSVAAELPIVLGCHPDYSRKRDVKIRIRLSNSNIDVVESLDDLVQQIRGFIDLQQPRRKNL